MRAQTKAVTGERTPARVEFWLWPDQEIGKRRSRNLREEHNAALDALLAQRDELLTLLKRLHYNSSKLCGEISDAIAKAERSK